MLYETANDLLTCILNLQITGETANGFVLDIRNHYMAVETINCFVKYTRNHYTPSETIEGFEQQIRNLLMFYEVIHGFFSQLIAPFHYTISIIVLQNSLNFISSRVQAFEFQLTYHRVAVLSSL